MAGGRRYPRVQYAGPSVVFEMWAPCIWKDNMLAPQLEKKTGRPFWKLPSNSGHDEPSYMEATGAGRVLL